MAGKTTKILVLLALVALAGAGCSDDNPTATPQNDTAPPAVPTNVAADYVLSNGTVTISWDPNTTDGDLAGYIVDKEYLGQITPLISTPTMNPYCQDANPGRGITLYHVYAVDRAGNASAVASTVLQIYSSHSGDRTDAN
jgi:hypothetical protein